VNWPRLRDNAGTSVRVTCTVRKRVWESEVVWTGRYEDKDEMKTGGKWRKGFRPSHDRHASLEPAQPSTVPLRTHAATRSKSDISASLCCRVLSLLDSHARSGPSPVLPTACTRRPRRISRIIGKWKVASIHTGQPDL
jgi:hypothetical protein